MKLHITSSSFFLINAALLSIICLVLISSPMANVNETIKRDNPVNHLPTNSASPVPKPIKKETIPVLLSADEISYNQETDTLIATGNVQIAQDNRILHADKVVYNKKLSKITATGNIYLKEPHVGSIALSPEVVGSNEFLTHQDYVLNRLMESSIVISNPLNMPQLGKQLSNSPRENEELMGTSVNYDVSFSPFAEFTNKFQDGYINFPKVLMSDDARLAATSAKRFAGQKTIFRQAVYSPCNVCKLNPQQQPLWQLKADKIIHSKQDQIVIYHHAQLEIAGVPVFYLPYFRHADPSVKRKSGFLMPAYGASSDLGVILSAPFYYVIDKNRDLTLFPIITTKQGPVIVGEYRHRLRDGEVSGSASYTQTKDLKKIPKGSNLPGSDRWHIFTQGRLDLNDEHVATFDINRASDTTYLRRYPLIPQGIRLKYPTKNMVSTAAIEEFGSHNYGVVRATAFQTDDPSKTPYLLPHAWYNYQSDPDQLNGIWNFDASFLSLGRRQDTPGQNARHMQRLSLCGGWQVPYISLSGHSWLLQLALRGDSYAMEHFQPNLNKPSLPSSFKTRLFPTGSIQWKYPLIKRLSNANWVIEPTAMIVGTTRVNNNTIPNEDSLNIQVEDTSLFLPQRFSGLDRVDTGGRFIYGGNSTWYFPQKRLVQIFLGQNVRLDHNQVLPSSAAGENKHASDIVSRFRVHPMDGIQLLNRMALRYKNSRPRISDTSAIFGKKLLVLQLNHTFVNKKSTANGVGISQATWVLGSSPLDHWSFSIGETRNLKRHQRGALSRTLSALYHDECFRLTLSAFKSRATDRDIRPNSGFILQLDFKNLGSINPLDTLGINSNNTF